MFAPSVPHTQPRHHHRQRRPPRIANVIPPTKLIPCVGPPMTQCEFERQTALRSCRLKPPTPVVIESLTASEAALRQAGIDWLAKAIVRPQQQQPPPEGDADPPPPNQTAGPSPVLPCSSSVPPPPSVLPSSSPVAPLPILSETTPLASGQGNSDHASATRGSPLLLRHQTEFFESPVKCVNPKLFHRFLQASSLSSGRAKKGHMGPDTWTGRSATMSRTNPGADPSIRNPPANDAAEEDDDLTVASERSKTAETGDSVGALRSMMIANGFNSGSHGRGGSGLLMKTTSKQFIPLPSFDEAAAKKFGRQDTLTGGDPSWPEAFRDQVPDIPLRLFLDDWEKRPNGTLRVATPLKELILDLIAGASTLQRLNPTTVVDLTMALPHLNIAQLVLLRTAQRLRRDQCPPGHLRALVDRLDCALAEMLFNYVITNKPNQGLRQEALKRRRRGSATVALTTAVPKPVSREVPWKKVHQDETTHIAVHLPPARVTMRRTESNTSSPVVPVIRLVPPAPPSPTAPDPPNTSHHVTPQTTTVKSALKPTSVPTTAAEATEDPSLPPSTTTVFPLALPPSSDAGPSRRPARLVNFADDKNVPNSPPEQQTSPPPPDLPPLHLDPDNLRKSLVGSMPSLFRLKQKQATTARTARVIEKIQKSREQLAAAPPKEDFLTSLKTVRLRSRRDSNATAAVHDQGRLSRYEDAFDDSDLVDCLTPVEKQLLGKLCLLIVGSITLLRRAASRALKTKTSWWLVPLQDDSSTPYRSKKRGIFLQYPSLIAQTQRPSNTRIYSLRLASHPVARTAYRDDGEANLWTVFGLDSEGDVKLLDPPTWGHVMSELSLALARKRKQQGKG